MKTNTVCLVLAALIFSAASLQAQNKVSNGEFIQPDNFATPTNNFLGFYGNGTTLGAWNVSTTFDLDYFRGSANGYPPTPDPSADGYWVYLVDQDYITSHVTTISQNLGSLPSLNQVYSLSFLESPTDNTGDVFFDVYPTLGSVSATLAGTPVFTQEFLSPTTWVTQTTNFTIPSDGAYTIGFTNNAAAGKGAGIDSVVVTPEPSSVILLAAAAAALIFKRPVRRLQER